MDISASLIQKDKTIVQGECTSNMEGKLDGMIQWMQETGLVLTAFPKMNRLHASNYPLNMFPLESVQGEERDGEKEEKIDQEYLGTEDEYEAMFQPQYSTLKGLIIRSLTKKQGGSSRREYDSGKHKALMTP